MARIALDDHRLYLNRHLQWMAFNQRVLDEARDGRNPLLERVKISGSYRERPGRVCGNSRVQLPAEN